MGRQLAPFELTRAELAARWLHAGSGIEIGALHQPLTVPATANVRYVDRKTVLELRIHYAELAEYEFVEPDVIDDGERLTSFADESQDFVIANHFIEHCEDPIAALANAFRVLRTGGILYLAAPDQRRTFDSERPLTSIEHLERDHVEGPGWSRTAHFEEWSRLVDHADDVPARMQLLMEMDYSIHFHVWTPDSFRSFIEHVEATQPDISFEIVEFVENEFEFIAILRKTASEKPAG
jgi:predicted SAM-dependent methyltransferase